MNASKPGAFFAFLASTLELDLRFRAMTNIGIVHFDKFLGQLVEPLKVVA
jgi:hypothetical protein